MSPHILLVFLLTLHLITSSEQVCDDLRACFYFISCSGEPPVDAPPPPADTPLNSSATTPLPAVAVSSQTLTVNATMNLSLAIAMKQSCKNKGLGLISRLSIEWTRSSAMVVIFESDLNPFGFTFGEETNSSFLAFDSTGEFRSLIDSVPADFEYNKSAPAESLGRTTYTFRVQQPEGKRLHAYFGNSVSILIGKGTFRFDADGFWKDLQGKLACNATAIHNACHHHEEDDCDELPPVKTRSLSCKEGHQMEVQSNSKWHSISSVDCIDHMWIFKRAQGGEDITTSSEEINVTCRKIAPNETTALPPHNEKVHRGVDSSLKPDSVAPAAQQGKDATDAESTKKKEEGEKLTLPGNKWLWIGGGVTLLLVIIIVNIVVCLICRNRNRNSPTKKQSKATKNKKESKRPDSSHNASHSTSESKGDPANIPLIANSSNPRPSTSEPSVMHGQTTEFGLDNLKTEKFN